MDYNFLQNNAFIFTLPRLGETSFRVISLEFPEIVVPPAQGGTTGSTQYHPGTFNEFGDLSLEFIVDENMLNYEELYRWITQLRFPGTEFTPKTDFEVPLVADGVLVTLTNSSQPNRVFMFKDMFPIALSGFKFVTTEDNVDNIICTATFKFSYFTLKPIGEEDTSMLLL